MSGASPRHRVRHVHSPGRVVVDHAPLAFLPTSSGFGAACGVRTFMNTTLRACALPLIGALLCPWPLTAWAQPPRAPQGRTAGPAAVAQPASPAAADDRVFAEAARLSQADVDGWIEAADAVLARTPTDRPAAARKVAAHLSAGRVREALVGYETWSKAAAREDTSLVRRIALEVVRRLRGAPTAELRAQALEVLARSGDGPSRQSLVEKAKGSSTSPDAWQARVALARLGDAASVAILASRARQGMGSQRLSALDALRGMPVTPEVVSALRESFGLEDHVLQGAAASLAGELGARDLVPDLRALAASGRFSVPLKASCALVALGDTSRRAFVDEVLGGELADAKLLAAQALAAAGADGWQRAIVPVLADVNPVNRLEAAALLSVSHAAQATPILTEALTDTNPVVREEAMRIVAGRPATPLMHLKRALLDDAPGVRLRAAAAIEARTR